MVDIFLFFLTLFVVFHPHFSLSIILAISYFLLSPKRSCLFGKTCSSEYLLLSFELNQTQQLKGLLQRYVAVYIEILHCSHCDRLSLYISELFIFVTRRSMTRSSMSVLSKFFNTHLMIPVERLCEITHRAKVSARSNVIWTNE